MLSIEMLIFVRETTTNPYFSDTSDHRHLVYTVVADLHHQMPCQYVRFGCLFTGGQAAIE